jgi:acetyltransferase-like isoleucine patch superfamily enzyme
MTWSYKLLNKLGLRLPPNYESITPPIVIKRAILFWYREFLQNMARFSVLFGPFASKLIRPALYRMIGVNVGKRVFIGQDVMIDLIHPHLVTIEDGALIALRTVILAHQRNLSIYTKGMWIGDCEHLVAPVLIKKGALIGAGTKILPGVTIGEGAVIGAGSVVTKDIPDWVLAAGAPAKVLKEFQEYHVD